MRPTGIVVLGVALIVSIALTACRGGEAPPPTAPETGTARPEGAAPPSAAEPTAVLYGRVLGSDHQGASPEDWQVRVTAEYEDGTDVAPRDRDSTGELFAFKVVPAKRVRPRQPRVLPQGLGPVP